MSDIVARLRASLRYDAVNGDSNERRVCARQMAEAANEIERLRAAPPPADDAAAREVADAGLVAAEPFNAALHLDGSLTMRGVIVDDGLFILKADSVVRLRALLDGAPILDEPLDGAQR